MSNTRGTGQEVHSIGFMKCKEGHNRRSFSCPKFSRRQRDERTETGKVNDSKGRGETLRR